MIQVSKVLKANGELIPTRVHSFTVDNEEELETKRKKFAAQYGMDIIFHTTDLRVKNPIPYGHHNKEGY